MAKRSVLCVAIVLGMATAGPAWAADSAKSEAMFGAGRRALDKGHFSAALVQLKKAAETDNGHHHHLVCRECGRSVEVEGPEVEQWAERVAAAAGYTDISHTVELFGLCANHA